MLCEFLVANRDKILASTRKKTDDVSDNKTTTDKSERGLPQFYDRLIHEMERESKGLPKVSKKEEGPDTTALHGEELHRLGYTVSQVVQGYGVLCQAITELATVTKAPISANEFKTLNLTLDSAIAEAITGFSKKIGDADCSKRLGILAHELRNTLTAAIIAHSMIKKGIVAHSGSTNALLERNLNRMRDILDRSFSEVRMQHEEAAEREPVLLINIVDEVEATAGEDARSRGLTIKVEVDRQLQAIGDSHYLISALSNLVQNAIKYSKENGTIWVRSRDADKNVILEVEDQCGGLAKGKAEELFQPFTQKNKDRTGLGLGLTISRQAVALNDGTLTVRDVPGEGCIFSMTLPKMGKSKSPPRRSV